MSETPPEIEAIEQSMKEVQDETHVRVKGSMANSHWEGQVCSIYDDDDVLLIRFETYEDENHVEMVLDYRDVDSSVGTDYPTTDVAIKNVSDDWHMLTSHGHIESLEILDAEPKTA